MDVSRHKRELLWLSEPGPAYMRGLNSCYQSANCPVEGFLFDCRNTVYQNKNNEDEQTFTGALKLSQADALVELDIIVIVVI